MKIDGSLIAIDFSRVAEQAREYEELGYDGLFTFEGPTEPFTPLMLAVEHTSRIELATGVAIAFARNPMILAQLAHELQVYSRGRFILGLGSQIKPHIERRFSATWSHPTARMRELILALRAIWECWDGDGKLDFRGRFYTHTLMTPIFNPGPNPYGKIPVFLGAVGTKMTEVAGEVADGVLVHPFGTPGSFEKVTRPALATGAARAGRKPEDVAIACQAMIVTGADEDEYQTARLVTRQQIAFYGSTPAYRCVLDAEGWGDLHGELHRLSKQGRWTEMSDLISDEILEAIAVCGEPKQVAARLEARYRGVADRLGFSIYYPLKSECIAEILATLPREAAI